MVLYHQLEGCIHIRLVLALLLYYQHKQFFGLRVEVDNMAITSNIHFVANLLFYNKIIGIWFLCHVRAFATPYTMYAGWRSKISMLYVKTFGTKFDLG